MLNSNAVRVGTGQPGARLAWFAALICVAAAWGYEPNASYTIKEIEGWKIHVHNELLGQGKQGEIGATALKKFQEDLALIKTWITGDPLKALRQVPIWLEVDSTNGPRGRTAVFHYHPELAWLEKMDFNPGKHKCVEFMPKASNPPNTKCAEARCFRPRGKARPHWLHTPQPLIASV